MLLAKEHVHIWSPTNSNVILTRWCVPPPQLPLTAAPTCSTCKSRCHSPVTNEKGSVDAVKLYPAPCDCFTKKYSSLHKTRIFCLPQTQTWSWQDGNPAWGEHATAWVLYRNCTWMIIKYMHSLALTVQSNCRVHRRSCHIVPGHPSLTTPTNYTRSQRMGNPTRSSEIRVEGLLKLKCNK